MDNGYTGQVVATSAAKADVTVEVVSGRNPTTASPSSPDAG
ncbi:hypothetical protein I553_5664 [Mycobacterium xenopi 4042]|uniref:Uncharacterized protein n=1 Tax=Mycobacterium xenopi 4042 TaxID=1299334 RepID=X7ZWN0_MYCXE|nr:hypothetical protein I553_5664 [Mycobacterium xenopi 4042]